MSFVSLFSINLIIFYSENENINYILIKHTEVTNSAESILDKSLHAPILRPVLIIPISFESTVRSVLPKLGNDEKDVEVDVDVDVDFVVDIQALLNVL